VEYFSNNMRNFTSLKLNLRTENYRHHQQSSLPTYTNKQLLANKNEQQNHETFN